MTFERNPTRPWPFKFDYHCTTLTFVPEFSKVMVNTKEVQSSSSVLNSEMSQTKRVLEVHIAGLAQIFKIRITYTVSKNLTINSFTPT